MESDTLLTDISTIIDDIDNAILSFTKALDELSEVAIKFINLYDDYVFNSSYDASYLKQRMKDVIMKAVANEF